MPFSSLLKGKLGYWQFRALFTQTTSTGTGTIEIAPGIGNVFVLDTYQIGPNDYGAGRLIVTEIQDEDDNEHLFILSESIDNARRPFPQQNVTDADGATDSKMRYVMITGDDKLVYTTTSLIATEVFTVSIRGYVKGAIPTITIATSAGTLPQSTTLNEVHL